MRVIVGAACVCVIVYFGTFAYWGDRGYLALKSTEKTLVAHTQTLNGLTGERKRIEHRIDLLQKHDPDLMEEIAHQKLLMSGPNQVAIPRENLEAAKQP